ncbi:Fc receptor-like protein 5 isoform X2 [Carcharodon carcharias]|uniref:Fc receptor-like protein 5 isoform X2 n=1 Tax=Carcharodon carcharias TaxID=13397 RepID=UPI001B7F0B5B|nr:Fc receptor-like protein 5 isoform X2 [Carcharodon carcharias]
MPRLHVTTKNNIGTAHVTVGTDGEQYSCAYSVNGRRIYSPVSEHVMVTITAPPSKPVIRLDQWTGVYVVGERVTITCSVTADDRDKNFHFYRGGQNLSLSQFTTKYDIGTARVTAGTDGEQYSCAYSASVNGRWIDSPLSEHVMVTITAKLSKPVISLDQWTKVYVFGERVTITCTAMADDRDKMFYFYRGNQDLSLSQFATKYDIGTARVTAGTDGEQYSCAYSASVNGRWIDSPLSEHVMVTITAPPSKPVIRLDQWTGVYVVGERVTITCSVTADDRDKNFHFYRGGQNLSLSQFTTKYDIGTARVTAGTDGEQYSCAYSVSGNGRWIDSPLSEHVVVTITDPLKTPVIYLDQATGVYAVGQTITMTCTVTGDNREKMFYFYKGHQQLPFNTSSRNTETFTFPNSGLSHSGQYRCQYRVTVRSRQFDSKQSQAITVAIEEKNPVALAAVVGSALGLILLLALLGVCVWRKGKKENMRETRNAVPSREQNNEHLTLSAR